MADGKLQISEIGNRLSASTVGDHPSLYRISFALPVSVPAPERRMSAALRA